MCGGGREVECGVSETNDQIEPSVPYREPSELVVAPPKRFSLMLWIERFFASRKLRIVASNDGLSVLWTDRFNIPKNEVAGFCEWLLAQPDDEPIVIGTVSSENKKGMLLMERGYVRPFQEKLPKLASAIRRSFPSK